MNPTPKRLVSHLFIFFTCLLAALHQAGTPLQPLWISEHASGIPGTEIARVGWFVNFGSGCDNIVQCASLVAYLLL